jgi:predicted transcriptional regulator
MNAKRQQLRLGDLEGAVLEALWERGPLTTPAVYEAVGRPRELAYTTILTVLQRLTKKGLVTRKEDGKAHTYSPAWERDEYNRRRAHALAAEVVPLGAAGMAAFLAEAERLDPDVVATLRKALESHP